MCRGVRRGVKGVVVTGQSYLPVFAASLMACLVTSIGIAVISRHEDWGRTYSAYFVSFAAGVLISVSFLHIIPEAFSLNAAAPAFLLAGFLMMHVTNRLLHLYICHEGDCEDRAMGLLPMLGIGFHSFVDGIIYTVAFRVSVLTGVLAAIGMIFHEFPEGVVTFVLLQRAGYPRRRAVAYAFGAAAASTPLGTLLSFPLVQRVSHAHLGLLLALSAGALVYVGASHLLPEVEHAAKRHTLLALTSGVLVALVIVLSHG